MAAPADLIRKIRRIEITTRRAVQDTLAGGYHSVFKGRGMAFSEVRPYQPGDEIRSIDWNVTARMGEPFVKVFTEERELTALIAMDRSASQDAGFAPQASKAEVAAEIAALLIFSALENGDRAGLLLFTDRLTRSSGPKSATRSSAGFRSTRCACAPATTTWRRWRRCSGRVRGGAAHDAAGRAAARRSARGAALQPGRAGHARGSDARRAHDGADLRRARPARRLWPAGLRSCAACRSAGRAGAFAETGRAAGRTRADGVRADPRRLRHAGA